MAIPTAVNGQITDAVTQANITVLGQAPSMAIGQLYQATAHALGIAALNATGAQQQSTIVAQAATARSVALILGGNT